MRVRIDAQLQIDALTGPDDRTSRWELFDAQAVDPDSDDAVLGARLASEPH